MKNKGFLVTFLSILIICNTMNAKPDNRCQDSSAAPELTSQELKGTKYLGGLSPEKALEYMESTPNLYIIDVREPEWYDGYTKFTGNVHIPYSELPKRYKDIPSDRPVLLNCGAGVMAPKAYKFLKEHKANIKELSYIAGVPKFKEYNDWAAKKGE